MTHDAHIREAERLLSAAKRADAGTSRSDLETMLRFATVHALLALVNAVSPQQRSFIPHKPKGSRRQ